MTTKGNKTKTLILFPFFQPLQLQFVANAKASTYFSLSVIFVCPVKDMTACITGPKQPGAAQCRP